MWEVLGMIGQIQNMIYRTYTYNDAINKAKAINAKIIYDNDSYNLHFTIMFQNKTMIRAEFDKTFT